MRRTALISLSIILTSLTGCSVIKSTDVLNFVVPANGYTLQEFQFGDEPRQRMDVYRPKGEVRGEPVFFVYGGAWRQGEKKDYKFLGEALTGLGHPVVIANYRLYPDVTFPAFVEDIADAIAYSQQHSATIFGRPLEHFILMGHSSGAHTAALLTTDHHFLRARSVTAQQSALIALSGPYQLPLDDPEVTTVFPGVREAEVQPVEQTAPDLPPTLLLHGADDERVLPFHTKAFASALEANDAPVEVKLYPGVGHVRIMAAMATPLRFLADTHEDVAAFLKQTRF